MIVLSIPETAVFDFAYQTIGDLIVLEILCFFPKWKHFVKVSLRKTNRCELETRPAKASLQKFPNFEGIVFGCSDADVCDQTLDADPLLSRKKHGGEPLLLPGKAKSLHDRKDPVLPGESNLACRTESLRASESVSPK